MDEHGCWGLTWERNQLDQRSQWQVSPGPGGQSSKHCQDTIKIYEQMLDSNMQQLDCRGLGQATLWSHLGHISMKTYGYTWVHT